MLSQMDIEALIRRLQDHALADAPGTMSEAEVDIAIALLDRVLPDLRDVAPCTARGQSILLKLAGTTSADNCPFTKTAAK